MRGRRGEKKELGKGNEERGGDGEKSNGAQFHGWVGVREGGSTTRMEEMHGEMAKTFIGPLTCGLPYPPAQQLPSLPLRRTRGL